MLRFTESQKNNIRGKWGFLLAAILILSILLGVRSVRAVEDHRVDIPNPKVEPLLAEGTEIPSLTSLADGYRGPGVYSIEVASNGQVSIVNRWCTRNQAILAQNIDHIRFTFEINGIDVLSNLHNYEEIDDDGTGQAMYCHGYRGLVSDWPIGEHEIRYGLSMDEVINDGWDNYPAGEIAWEFVVNASQGVAMPVTGTAPSIVVSLNTNCRKGPGKAYEIIGGLQVGEVAEVVGVYPNADYWIIIDPNNGRECWLWGNYAEVTGDINQLQTYCPPLLPTATPTSTPDPNGVNTICFCNDTGDHISAMRLFNDDTDEWVGDFGYDGFVSGFCDCFSSGQAYPFGDYAVEYKICDNGATCTNYGATFIQSFDLFKDGQYIEINP